MGVDTDKVRATKVLASAKALGINVVDVDLHRALISHNAPHDHVFDKAVNSTARLFMRNVARAKAVPKALHGGYPVSTYGFKCILIVDSDRIRRDDVAVHLATSFKVAVASTKKDAIQVVHMMHVHIILARLRFGNDTALELVRDCLDKRLMAPVVLFVGTTLGHEELVAACLDAGACGYIEDALPPEILQHRLHDIMRSFSSADEEWQQTKPKPVEAPTHKQIRPKAIPRSANGFRRSSRLPTADELSQAAASIPTLLEPLGTSASLTALDVKIQDRQNYLAKQQHVQEVMTIKHSVLGLGKRKDKPPTCLNKDLVRVEHPAPSRELTVEFMYSRPHTVASLVQQHDYSLVSRGPRDAVPQEPLLAHCIVVDPTTLCDSKSGLKRINRAYLAYEADDWEIAINWCTASLKVEPNHLPKWCLLMRGALHDRLGDYRLALVDFDAALAIDPTFHEAMFNKSVSWLKLGQDAAALQIIVAAQELGGPQVDYIRNHALILRRMGRYEEARVVYASLDPARVSRERDMKPTSLDSMLEDSGLNGGLFDALFCQARDEKAAFQALPHTRTSDMVDVVTARLFSFDFFVRFPDSVVRNVAQALEHVVVRTGETFYLAHETPHAFYICVQGTLSIHANLTIHGQDMDTMASSSTHRIRMGDVFGCVGVKISSLMMYLADEWTEIMYLTPEAFKQSLEPQWLIEQHGRFSVCRRSAVFRLLTDSELGHLVSHSILVRFHKGDVLVQQHEYPKRLYILYKGICRFEQSFALKDDSPLHEEAIKTTMAKVKPYHHYLEIPNWPLDFCHTSASSTPPSVPPQAQETAKTYQPSKSRKRRPPTIVYDLYPPALFGESAYKTVPEKAQWYVGRRVKLFSKARPSSIIAATLVEALAIDMHQLKSMSLAKEIFSAVLTNAPLYVDAAKAERLHDSHVEWTSIRGKEAVHVNKARWPMRKERLRHLPNGGSIVVPDEKTGVFK
ncbi:unnamed protein product [Aphanomyces euteiches]